jgi:hypothetical protein
MVAVRDELLALREELAAYAARLPAAANSADTDAQDALPAIWKGAQLNGYRATNGNGNGTRRSANQVKRHVAA